MQEKSSVQWGSFQLSSYLMASLFPQGNHTPGNFFFSCPVLLQSCPDLQRTILGVGWYNPYSLSCPFISPLALTLPLNRRASTLKKDAYPPCPIAPSASALFILLWCRASGKRSTHFCSPPCMLPCASPASIQSCTCAAGRQVGRKQNHPDWSHLTPIPSHPQ